MFKNARRRYRKYRFDHRYDYPAMFASIWLMSALMKVLAVAVVTYGLYFVVVKLV